MAVWLLQQRLWCDIHYLYCLLPAMHLFYKYSSNVLYPNSKCRGNVKDTHIALVSITLLTGNTFLARIFIQI